MKLQIEHQTSFTYEQPVREAIGEARLRPRDEAGQRCLSFRITTDPTTPINQVIDRFGNLVHCYSVLPPHTHHVVVATSVVETSATPLLYAAPLSLIEQRDFLSTSRFVPRTGELDAFAHQHAPAGATAEQAALALNMAIYTNCEYQPGSTDISTTADGVLAGRRGVCQDFAHLLIALCRCLELPARYVSGYLHDVAQVPDAIVASHAWAEVFLEGRGWLGLDPTHNRTTGPNYVRVALGRDYADATPVRGVYTGGAHETLEVQVRIRALLEDLPQIRSGQ
jgi:transglutaminase-like putative cysteine protease